MNLKFIHIRRYNGKGELQSTGGITFGVMESDTGAHFMISKARCSLKDTFCRKAGRLACEGRMQKRMDGVQRKKAAVYIMNKEVFPSFIERVAKRLRAPYPVNSVSFIMEPKKVKAIEQNGAS